MNINFITKISILCLVLLASCSKKYLLVLNVDTIGSNNNYNTFWILNTKPGSLYFNHFSNQITEMLIKNNYIPAKSKEAAEIGIELEYGISSIDKKIDYLTTFYGYSKSSTRVYVSYKYNMFLKVKAFDLKQSSDSKNNKELWVANIDLYSYNSDLRLYFPFLISGLENYLFTDTGTQISKFYLINQKIIGVDSNNKIIKITDIYDIKNNRSKLKEIKNVLEINNILDEKTEVLIKNKK